MFAEPLNLLIIVPALLIAITVHEFSHAFVAHLLGDRTAKLLGRLSLNPLVHLDPLGTLMMAVTALTGFGIGWGKPVPVNPNNLRYGPRNGMALVALAGPISNVVLATAMLFVIRFGLTWNPALYARFFGRQPLIGNALEMLIVLNVALAVFNMLPIVPLDGSRVLLALLPSGLAYRVQKYEMYGPAILMGVIFTDQFFRVGLFSAVLSPTIIFVLDFLSRSVLGGRGVLF